MGKAAINLRNGYIRIPIYDKSGEYEDLCLVSDSEMDENEFRFVPGMDKEQIDEDYGLQYILGELTRHTQKTWRIINKGEDRFGYVQGIAYIRRE